MLLAVLRICLGDGGRKRDVAKGRRLEDGVMQGELHLEVKGKTQSKAIQFMATKNCQTCPGASQVGHQEELSTLQPKGQDGKCGRRLWLLGGIKYSYARTGHAKQHLISKVRFTPGLYKALPATALHLSCLPCPKGSLTGRFPGSSWRWNEYPL